MFKIGRKQLFWIFIWQTLKNEINLKNYQLFLFGPKCIQKSGSPENLSDDPHTPFLYYKKES